MANGLDVGLGASVWSSDVDAARAVAARIQSGTVWINKYDAVDPRVPFGGAKQSGYGLEFGVEGLKAAQPQQLITVAARRTPCCYGLYQRTDPSAPAALRRIGYVQICVRRR